MSVIEQGWYFIDDTIQIPTQNQKETVSYVKITALHPMYRVEYYDSDLNEITTETQKLLNIHPVIKTGSTTTAPYNSSNTSCF